jgi:cbb3-type cytochrome oxidase maturation protein
VLIPVSLAMGLIGLCAFFWALRRNQFDDPDGNAARVPDAEDHPKATPARTDRGTMTPWHDGWTDPARRTDSPGRRPRV